MGNLFLNKIKKQASYFLHEKYKTARLFLTDATQAELLAEDATGNDVGTPDNITMTMIAEASYESEDYWKIVDVLHRRLDEIDWMQWRQLYKSLVLLEFLIIHGPDDLGTEFLCDVEIIKELGSFKYRDERGFDWGLMMQRKSERILNLLQDDDALKQARLKAQRISGEIHGFGSSTSPAPSPSSSSSSSSSWSSSLGSNSTTSSSISDDTEDSNKDVVDDCYSPDITTVSPRAMMSRLDDKPSPSWTHCYNRKEKESLLVNVEDEEEEGDKDDPNFLGRLCSRLGISPRGHDFRCHSFKRLDDGKEKRMLLRQFSRR
ncbi:PREDICTED: epsin-3 [Ipomoea nil]|uniref:epsin-3 n=1 Tax=Ipomoea nil TaxID=35883 RepID=UPI000901A258|nr:PREDICTED: epsin-3 [Ipomoea nil]